MNAHSPQTNSIPKRHPLTQTKTNPKHLQLSPDQGLPAHGSWGLRGPGSTWSRVLGPPRTRVYLLTGPGASADPGLRVLGPPRTRVYLVTGPGASADPGVGYLVTDPGLPRHGSGGLRATEPNGLSLFLSLLLSPPVLGA